MEVIGKMRRVVCAAVRYPCGTMLVGPRHLDVVMLSQYKRFFSTGNAPGEDQADCGFLDQNGIFMDRVEALGVATSAGQVVCKTAPVDRLFTEDMY